MSAVDTSVVVPALLSWHASHERCRRVAKGARLPMHALLESYSVLTRLPPPHRVPRETAHRSLEQWFPTSSVLALSVEHQRGLLAQLYEAGIEGGGVYDGLVGLIAKAHDERLVTRDRRAAGNYRRLGVDFELLSPD